MSRPRLVPLDRRLLPGLIAVALFAVIAAVVLGHEFVGEAVGFDGVSVVSGIGYALIGASDLAAVPVESFLVALILIAIVLDAALDGALMLAKRDGGEE
jgi:NADH-quinone oxidoreductase subunit J